MIQITFIFLVSLALLSYLGVIIRRIWFSPISDIPGPFWARTSSAWQLWHVFKGTNRIAIQHAHEQYGPFVRVSHKEVSVCHSQAVRKILLPSHDKGTWYSIFSMPNSSFVCQMSELSAKKFAVVQKKIIRGYSLANILDHESMLDEAVRLFMTGVEQATKRDGSVYLGQWVTFFALDLVGSLTFSKDFGFLKAGRDLGGCVATSDQLIGYLAIMAHFPGLHDYLDAVLAPILAWFGMTPMKHVQSTTETALKRREEDVEKDTDMVSIWRSYKGEPMSEKEIFATANANIAAGGDTSSSMNQAFVYHVLKNPAVKEKLVAELDKAAEAGTITSPVQYRDALTLPYFQACMKETFRVHPVVSAGFPRIAPQGGLEIDGKHFPAGTVMSVNAWAVHNDKTLFGSDASEFKPERWLTGDTAQLDRNFITFGAGYMTCPGRHLATVEMSKLMSTLFLDYDVALVEPAKEWRIRETILVKGHDWMVTVKRREGDGKSRSEVAEPKGHTLL